MASVQPLPLACPDCAAQMPETAAFCPGCGRSMSTARSFSGPARELGGAPEQGLQKQALQERSLEEQGKEEQPHPLGRVGGLPENVAGAMAYVTCFPAILWLLVRPYKNNRFIRFHSFQSLLLWAGGIVLAIALRLSGLALFHVPMVGPLLIVLLWGMVALAVVLIWLVLLVKALQGEMFELPVLGRFADLYAGRQAEE